MYNLVVAIVTWLLIFYNVVKPEGRYELFQCAAS